MTKDYICNSSLATWHVIEIFDTEVPEDVLKALEAEQKRTRQDVKVDKRGAVYSLMWEDMLFFHGEDGWCIDDETLEVCQVWLEDHRKEHGIDEQVAFWFRVKRS